MSSKPLIHFNVHSFQEVRQALQALANSIGGHTHAASDITTGQLALARGGTAADMSATGGTGHVVKQASAGAVFTTGQVATADIADDAVTYAKMQNVSATDMLLGRSTAGAGNVEEIALTAAGRAILDDANAAAQRVTLGLEIGVNVQAYDADLVTWAGLTPSANAQSLVTAADYAAMRVLLGLVIGTNVQAYDADLTIYAGITPSANVQSLLAAASYAAMRALLDLEAGTDFYSIAAADAAFQAKDSDLTTIAGLTATSDNFIQSSSSAWASRTPTQATATLIAMVGDSGSGGTKGLAPAPAAGDAAALKFLKADGTWAVPAGGAAASDTVAGVIEIAIESEQETGTSTTLAVTPGRQHFHQSAAKGWCHFWHTGGTPTAFDATNDYNVSSLGDGGVGTVTVNWGTDFTGDNDDHCAVVCGGLNNGATTYVFGALAGQTTAATDVVFRETAAAYDVDDAAVVAFGLQ